MSDVSGGKVLERPDDATRAKLCIALDVDDLVEANRLARDMQPFFGVAKVGLELYAAAGPDVIGALHDLGYDVFLDLKLHDIPTTVERSSRVIGALGVNYLTLHAQGGLPMMMAGVQGLAEGAAAAGLPTPTAVAVTVLTSDGDAPEHIMPRRAANAVEAGCGGIVCSASDLADARQIAPRLTRVVPGIRMPGAPEHDQARVSTPRDAVDEGADLLVVGRAITESDDRIAAAAAIAGSVQG